MSWLTDRLRQLVAWLYLGPQPKVPPQDPARLLDRYWKE